jgi:hypothetical protein
MPVLIAEVVFCKLKAMAEFQQCSAEINYDEEIIRE